MDSDQILVVTGLALAAAFWILTQINVILVGKKVNRFQVEAREHADKVIAEAFARMEEFVSRSIAQIRIPDPPAIPDLAQMENRITAEISAKVAEVYEIVPDSEELRTAVMSSVNDQLNQLGPELQKLVAETVGQQLKVYESVQTRRLGQELSKVGIDIENAGKEIQNEIMGDAAGGLTPKQMAIMKILGTKVSPAYAEDNPVATMLLDLMRVQAAEMFVGSDGTNSANSLISHKNPSLANKSSPFG